MPKNKTQFDRTIGLIGEEATEKLARAKVCVLGLGGVGGHACEALARAGIGALTIVDSDDVDITNINRQIIATHSTVGRSKVDVMAERIADINPECKVEKIKMLYLPETADAIELSNFDYVVDAIDNVSAKIELAVRCNAQNVPLVASMGTGNKLDPSRFELADISKTSVCPLARVMRRELKKRGINHLMVVYSKEEPVRGTLTVPASISFVPPAAGLLLAAAVVRSLI